MKLKPCRMYSESMSSQCQSPPLDQSPETSSDIPPDKNKSFVQIDQSATFQLLQDLDATEFKAFLFLTMRAYGWDDKARRVGDGVTRASGTFVAQGAKLSLATAERCIGSLKEKGLITKSSHSCKWGNTYFVKPLLLRRHSVDKSLPPPEKEKKPPQIEVPQIEVPQNEGTQKEELKTIQVPQIAGPSPLKNTVLAPSNCGTNTDSRSLDLSLTETFENYFSKIRAPMAEKKERACFAQIQKRNPDVTQEELVECFNLVSKSKDSKGKSISMKFLWMAHGFDSILTSARGRLQGKKYAEDERQAKEQAANQEAALDQQTSAEEVEQAKQKIRALLGHGLFQTITTLKKPQSEKDRRVYLLAQAKQIQEIEKFGNL